MAGTGITVLITGRGLRGHRRKEDVGITIREKNGNVSC